MMRRAGFTIVELAITITIMAILVTLSVVNLNGTQANARDEERKTDIGNIILYLEGIYTSGTPNNPDYRGSYPPTSAASSTANIESWFSTLDKKSLQAPGTSETSYSLVPATSTTQTTAGVLPQPTTNTYVYQPITTSGALCAATGDCRKFNLFYRLEVDNSVHMITSKHQ
ncbi:MAG TPA: type II secretion system protein [Candidatus Saccharimonadales bacterium]|nr:type II secretion system protein [Candidatus Saccharimonadales bacterium]